MNGHDDLLKIIDWKDQNKQYDENGDEIVEEETQMLLGNPMIDYESQDELDRVGNRESYQAFRGF